MARPVLHYFDLRSLGRGEVVRLFLRELDISFEDKRYPYEDSWNTKNPHIGLTAGGKLPVLEIDNHKLSQHIPILRYLARRVNGYDGESNFEKFLVDAVSDVYIDWRSAWVASLSAKSDDFARNLLPNFYASLNEFYAIDKDGPYLLGQRPTYADFAVYQALDNSGVTTKNAVAIPDQLLKLKQAMELRSNLTKYLGSRREE